MLAVGLGEEMGTIGHRDIVIIVVVVRMSCSIQRIIARITDWSGRQTLVGIQVVGAVQFEVFFGQRIVVTDGILQRRVNL